MERGSLPPPPPVLCKLDQCLIPHIFPHNIYVLGLLSFAPANATAEWYENGFPQRPLPPERIEVIIVIIVPLLNSFYTEMQILIPAQPDFT